MQNRRARPNVHTDCRLASDGPVPCQHVVAPAAVGAKQRPPLSRTAELARQRGRGLLPSWASPADESSAVEVGRPAKATGVPVIPIHSLRSSGTAMVLGDRIVHLGRVLAGYPVAPTVSTPRFCASSTCGVCRAFTTIETTQRGVHLVRPVPARRSRRSRRWGELRGLSGLAARILG